jgi:hypothetical protein
MVHSMTGFSSTDWITDDINFSLELKSVNGRGLDLRTRLPTGFEDLEKKVKSILGCINKTRKYFFKSSNGFKGKQQRFSNQHKFFEFCLPGR